MRGRPRTVASLLAGVGLASTGYIAMLTVAPLVAEDLLGSPRWSGLPSTIGIVGGALGTTWLSGVMARRGHGPGLVVGYAAAAATALAAAVAVTLGSFWLFLAAVFLVGAGSGAARLARYTCAELYPPEHRAAAIGWMVWGGTIGSVLGPALLEPSRALAAGLELDGLVGPYVMGAVAVALAAVSLPILGDHRLLAAPGRATTPALRSIGSLLFVPRVRMTLLAMVIGQVVMVLIMTMTPVHVRASGHGLAAIGLVISAHTLGMYALSPLTGALSDRLGRVPVILWGEVMLLTAALLAASAGASQWRLVLALFLLGLGWNFGFVAGSALLTDSVPADQRIQAQGVADSVIWASGAVASLGSGVLVAASGYTVLSLAGAALTIIAATVIVRHRRLLQADVV